MPTYAKDCREPHPGNPENVCLLHKGHDGAHTWEPTASFLARNNAPTFFDKVAHFHKTAEVEAPTRPTLEEDDGFLLTTDLIREEFHEMCHARNASDIVEFADAVADLTYVVLRAGYMAGLPMNEIFNEVHRSNMSKFPDGVVIRRADGKILKPDSWTPPNLKEIING